MAARTSIAELEIPGGWTERDVEVAGRRLSLLVPAAPDEFLNELDEATLDSLPRLRSDPYWAQVWTAALPFASAVAAADWPPGTRALELGCGVGVVGLAAALAGCDVLITDYVPEAVELALENARRNRLSVRGMTLDWRSPGDEPFDVILGSDIVYDVGLHDCLIGLLDRMLAPGGIVWLGDPGRSGTSAFLERTYRAGFACQLFDQEARPIPVPALGRFQRIVLRRAGP